MLHHDYEWKGVAGGLEAVARVKRRMPSLRLVGFCVKPPRVPVGYDEFHADPPQERLAAIYSSCDIYLCPSWDEGLGMPSMEAMACGVALVTYDNGGCRGYARGGETAPVGRRRGVPHLAAELERLPRDPHPPPRLPPAGSAVVRQPVGWGRAVRRVGGVFP